MTRVLNKKWLLSHVNIADTIFSRPIKLLKVSPTVFQWDTLMC